MQRSLIHACGVAALLIASPMAAAGETGTVDAQVTQDDGAVGRWIDQGRGLWRDAQTVALPDVGYGYWSDKLTDMAHTGAAMVVGQVPEIEDARRWANAAVTWSGAAEAYEAIGSSVQLDTETRQAIESGLAWIPRDPAWWTDFTITAAGVGTVVGGASYGCAIVATPGGPVLMALAAGACTGAGSLVGAELVRLGYDWAELRIDESAWEAGRLTGTAAGLWLGVPDMGLGAQLRAFTLSRALGASPAARGMARRLLAPGGTPRVTAP